MREKILTMRGEGLTLKEIGVILGKSQTSVSELCKKLKIKVNNNTSEATKNKIRDYYKNHTRKETAKRFNVSETTVKKYGGKKRLPVMTEAQRKEKSVSLVMSRRRKLKDLALNYKGGCCEFCGYNKSTWALEFHHKDPSEKDFTISNSTYSWSKLKAELDKCLLLCRNCHAEVHEKIYKESKLTW